MKVALITGAGSGIGKGAALAMLNEGYQVVLTGRRREPLVKTVSEAGSTGERALVVPADVSKPEDVRILFSRIKDEFGRLDLLFNNAGINIPGVLLEDLTFDQWKKVLDINLGGAFLCTQEAFRIMKEQKPMGGRIINNGSLSAHVPRPDAAPYNITKHAITGLTKSTALDGRKYDIACGQIDIGNADTEMTGKMKDGVPQANGSVATEPTMPLNNVTNAILYMASLPLDANVLFLTVMATKMPYVGRG
jgi:NAD(P)-dependent dehydrogenase (short-subunit alcohol dehydrogenase family)